ncbi:MAG: hypothetical protein WCL70_10765 [Paludibacter sp.]
MKKILFSIMVLVSFSTTSFAINQFDDYKALHKLTNKDTFVSLVSYLNADEQQVSLLNEVFIITNNELNTAEKNDNDRFAESVLNYNLYNAKCILSENQYKRYLVFINYYLRNENLLSINK